MSEREQALVRACACGAHPRTPSSPDPHEKSAPSASTATECVRPHAISRTRTPERPDTRAGTCDEQDQS
eukprot:6202113-Pleurochrysis_carterae.AAC.1